MSVVSVSWLLVTVSVNLSRASLLVLRGSCTDTDLEPCHANLLRLLGGKWISPSKDIESQPRAIQAVVGVRGVVSASDQCQLDFGNSLGKLLIKLALRALYLVH